MSKSEKRFRDLQINIRVSKQEKKDIELKAKKSGLSASSYLRNLALYFPIKSVCDQLALDELIKTRADLGRLGGLLKYHITMSVWDKVKLGSKGKDEIDSLLTELESKQQALLYIAENLTKEISNGR